MEFLKEALGDELYTQVEAKLKGNEKIKLANLAGGEYVSKDKYAAALTEAEGLKASVAQTEQQLEHGADGAEDLFRFRSRQNQGRL